MKNIYRFILLVSISFSVQWLHGQSPTINLNRPTNGNQLHEATQNITLSAGFSYDAQNANTFNARVVPANGASYNYTEPTDNSIPNINTAYPVGSIEGSWNVSPNGEALYSIPVKIPPGINSMVPNLSVVYNSMSGEGLLGRKWDISGLSKITRVASDIYHDGYVDYIHFDANDHFALDGQRLIPVSSTADSTEYRTEKESFSRITAYGPAGNPTHFVLESKDGKIVEYGNTSDSNIFGFFWNVNKISDRSGNYITVTYSVNNNNGEHLPSAIKYTGTKSFAPFNTIEFEYQTRTIPVVSYVSGYPVIMASLIKNIYVKNEGTTISQYQFWYNTAESKLTEIVEYGKNSSRLNSTIVNWGTANTGISESSVFTDPQLTERYQGDFNGDGREDYVTIRNSQWKLYLADNSGNFIFTSSSSMPTNFKSVYTGDFNGDGKKDLLVICTASGLSSLSLLISTGVGFSTNTNANWPTYTPCGFLIGDFNGDGKDDYLAYNFTSTGEENYEINEFVFGTTITFNNLDIDHLNWGSKVYSNYMNIPLDVNGDGKTDLMVVSDTGAYFYELKYDTLYQTNRLTRILTTDKPYPNINPTCNLLFGDFNGDGLTDIATYNTNGIWNVYISTGSDDGFRSPFTSPYTFAGFIPNTNVNNFYAQDIDGDGKCDLVCVGRGKSYSDSVKIYVSYSNSIKYFDHLPTAYTPPTSLNIQNGDFNHLGDFNGDGTIDYYYDNGSTGKMYTLYRGRNQDLVASVKNGFGLSSGVYYKPLTDNTVYIKGSAPSTYPLMDYQGPVYVVSSAWTDNISGTQDVTNYSYSGALIHRMGKGFLGFQQVTSSNSLHNIQIRDRYEVNATYFNVALNNRSTFSADGRRSLSNSGYTNSLIEYGKKRILPYVSQIVDNNYLTGIIKTTSDTIDNNGNPKSTTETFDDGSYNRITYSNYSSEGSWMDAKPGNIIITRKHYADNQKFTLSTTNTYYPGTGLLNTSITGPLTTTYKYYDNGTPKQVTQSDGTTNRTSHFEYDTKGRFVTNAYNALDHLTQRTYDNATGNILTETAPNLKVTSYAYDNFGRQTGITYPTGQSVTISYEWATETRPTTALYYKLTTCPGVPSVKEYYDVFGRPLRTEKTGFDGTSIYASTVYNTKGQVIQSSLPYFEGQQALAKNYTYDDLGRLVYDAGPAGIAAYTYAGKTTQTVTGSGHVSSKTIDSQGNTVSSTDEGGSIGYLFKSLGKPGQITCNGVITSMVYDSYGRQTQLTDPNAGSILYRYNGFGELTSQTDALGHKDSLSYDVLGRTTKRTGDEGTTTYTYDPTDNPGLLDSIAYPGGSESYTYDTYGRLSGTSKLLTDGSNFTYNFGYKYDIHGRDSVVTYPSGLILMNFYNTSGYLYQVLRIDNAMLIWQGTQMNAFGQFTQSRCGNFLTITKSYNTIGQLTNMQTGSVQNLNYNFDPGTGNLLSRSDVLRNLTETFTYDNANRLTNISGPSPLGMAYNNTGNITSKTGIGDYTYAYLPHAVNQVSNPLNMVSTTTQTIGYTPFNKVDNISEGTASLQYTYDEGRQRSIAKLYQSGVLQKTTHYAGLYEKEIIGGNTRQINYIAGGDGLAAIYVQNNGLDTMYYVHTDHLGSYDVITNQAGAVVQYYSFDAWGRRRNPSSWAYTNLPAHSLFSRGFTGHEHLDAFSLINMNGRVYDPLLGRVLSPDNVVQEPGYSQSYNRYSYCLNNPLAYTDPSGYSLLSRFGNWVGEQFDRLGNWLTENHVNFQIGYSTNSGNFMGGTPFIKGSVDGTSLSVGYNLDTGNVGVGTDNTGTGNDGFTNFYYPSYNYAAPEQNAYRAIAETRAVYTNAYWLGRSQYAQSGGACTQYGFCGQCHNPSSPSFNDPDLIQQRKDAIIVKVWAGIATGAIGGPGAAAKTGTNLVYEGVDAAGTVRYVGITEREAATRFAEHAASIGTGKENLIYRVVNGAEDLSRIDARVWEQTLINQYGLGKNGGLLLNKINSIAPKNWWQYGINP